jgi:hypothetical protein
MPGSEGFPGMSDVLEFVLGKGRKQHMNMIIHHHASSQMVALPVKLLDSTHHQIALLSIKFLLTSG